mmetsp:Transcript_36014/g.107623  ORF Transcript_36014/g.107623 Transcript_36014/m.107623 type:complete len:223 (-) Transcript_36014:776-1444(-)
MPAAATPEAANLEGSSPDRSTGGGISSWFMGVLGGACGISDVDRPGRPVGEVASTMLEPAEATAGSVTGCGCFGCGGQETPATLAAPPVGAGAATAAGATLDPSCWIWACNWATVAEVTGGACVMPGAAPAAGTAGGGAQAPLVEIPGKLPAGAEGTGGIPGDSATPVTDTPGAVGTPGTPGTPGTAGAAGTPGTAGTAGRPGTGTAPGGTPGIACGPTPGG